MQYLLFFIISLVSWNVFAASTQQCYHPDKAKLKSGFNPINFFANKKLLEGAILQLNAEGLFKDNKRICKWSLNGGSGTKEKFSLDGDIAVPILDPQCEKPFSNVKTGNGFGDWEFFLCGTLIERELLKVISNNRVLYAPIKKLKQWSRFHPEKIDSSNFGD